MIGVFAGVLFAMLKCAITMYIERTPLSPQEHGVFEGTKRVGEADVHACKTMAATARQHAEAARRVQEHVREELRKQNREDNGK